MLLDPGFSDLGIGAGRHLPSAFVLVTRVLGLGGIDPDRLDAVMAVTLPELVKDDLSHLWVRLVHQIWRTDTPAVQSCQRKERQAARAGDGHMFKYVVSANSATITPHGKEVTPLFLSSMLQN